MASLFNGLHIGYSGLNAAQVGVNTTSHNLSNAETEGYTRQRVVTSAATPLSTMPGANGNGVVVDEITRIFDGFVYKRYSDTGQSKEYSDFMRQTMEELSTYFPDIDGVGIKSDLAAYYNSWQNLVDAPDSTAVKIDLAQQTSTLAINIEQTREQIFALQNSMDVQLKVAVDEVNRLGNEIANLNGAISEAESGGQVNANDLRDKRDLLQNSLSKLIGADVFSESMQSNVSVNSSINEPVGNYNINVGGFNLVDGTSFHPIGTDNSQNSNGFHELYYERQDGKRIPIEDSISGGKIGSILDLRGTDVRTISGVPDDGILQESINDLDAFAASLIEYSNTIYAESATDSMTSNKIDIGLDVEFTRSGLHVNEGTFDVAVYDIDGKEVARREITINSFTTMETALGNLADGTPNTIRDQFEAQKDDNDDNNPLNDVDDLIQFNYTGGQMSLNMKSEFAGDGYTFSVIDNKPGGDMASGTNFAGAIGLSKYFDGTDASDIALASSLRDNPADISAHQVPLDGDNAVGLSMVQMQFETINFTRADGNLQEDTIYGFYDSLATSVGTKTNAAILFNESMTAQFNAVELEYQSISKVSIDEEMTNLIKYQASYGASAKVISTIDQMLNTLLGIKQ